MARQVAPWRCLSAIGCSVSTPGEEGVTPNDTSPSGGVSAAAGSGVPQERRVTVGGRAVHLTATEYALLRTLALHPGKVLTHGQLLRAVWGPGYTGDSHLLRVNMSNLRRKIEPNPLKPQYIITEPGVGYRLREDVRPTSG
ncbi:MAG: winged helix-turn-helix transcriptional regulator [Limnochordaceae bacterium]|nr:winged helix-turn-helix transcriptional regulator [Limnochordaceae bacterium]